MLALNYWQLQNEDYLQEENLKPLSTGMFRLVLSATDRGSGSSTESGPWSEAGWGVAI